MTTLSSPLIRSDPEILGGTPVFAGTRVPYRTFLDYLEGGDSLDEFLEDFPTVSRQQAIAALRQNVGWVETQLWATAGSRPSLPEVQPGAMRMRTALEEDDDHLADFRESME
jgi:uncharacterized protein (DUF433 family)